MHLSLPYVPNAPSLSLFLNYTWSYGIKKLPLDHTVNSYVAYGFWNKLDFFPKQWVKWSFSWAGGFWGTNWSFIYKLNKLQVTRFNIFLVSPYNEVLSVALLNPYPANVENNARKWQMGFNSAFKGLSRNGMVVMVQYCEMAWWLWYSTVKWHGGYGTVLWNGMVVMVQYCEMAWCLWYSTVKWHGGYGTVLWNGMVVMVQYCEIIGHDLL